MLYRELTGTFQGDCSPLEEPSALRGGKWKLLLSASLNDTEETTAAYLLRKMVLPKLQNARAKKAGSGKYRLFAFFRTCFHTPARDQPVTPQCKKTAFRPLFDRKDAALLMAKRRLAAARVANSTDIFFVDTKSPFLFDGAKRGPGNRISHPA